jgi:uncharacterized membrane protein HdeD (DUF308 family)
MIMSETNDTSMATGQDLALGEMKKNWKWLLFLGIAFLILGIIGLSRAFTLTIASVYFFGFLILIGGAIQLFESFKCKGWKGFIWHLIISIIYILVGIQIIARPLVATTFITLMIAIGIILVGILRIVMAIQHRGLPNWGWPLFSGIVSILLGLVIAARWPVSGLFVIGLFVAIELIIHGWSYLFLALAAKSARPSSSSPAPA